MKAGIALVAVVAAIVLAAFSGSSAAVGDPAFCPPGEVETLIAEQIAVLGQLNPAPSAGVGTGKNAQANAGRFGSLQARLQDALAALAAGNTAGALEAIASVVAKADGAPSPPDWLTAATATALADELGCITGAIGGGGSNANVYVSVSPDFAVGPHRIVEETIGAGGSLSLLGSLTTSGDSNLNQSEQGMAVSPDGSLVFVSHNASQEVEAFGRLADGSLVSASVVPTAFTPSEIVVHPTLPVIYVSETDRTATPADQVSVFSYTPDGVLTHVETRMTEDEIRGIAITPDGSALLTTHIFSVTPTVAVYSIGVTGSLSLSPVDTDAPAGASRIDDVFVDSSGSRVFVKDLDEGIYEYVLSGGILTALNGGVPYAGGLFNVDAVTVPGALVVLSWSAAPSSPVDFRVFPITATGLGPPTLLSVADDLQHLAVTGDGTTLFASARTGDRVRSFTIAGGSLTENVGSPFAIPVSPTENVGNLVVSD